MSIKYVQRSAENIHVGDLVKFAGRVTKTTRKDAKVYMEFVNGAHAIFNIGEEFMMLERPFAEELDGKQCRDELKHFGHEWYDLDAEKPYYCEGVSG